MIPLVRREPELVHGIRNIVHNALKFSKSSVDINLIVNARKIILEIIDDGVGFPHDVKNMIGEPFLKRSDLSLTEAKTKTPEEGMDITSIQKWLSNHIFNLLIRIIVSYFFLTAILINYLFK